MVIKAGDNWQSFFNARQDEDMTGEALGFMLSTPGSCPLDTRQLERVENPSQHAN